MSTTVGTGNHSSFLSAPHVSYLATGTVPLGSAGATQPASGVYSYSVSYTGLTATAAFAVPVSNAGTAISAPVAGTLLRKNGKKLIPGVHVGVTKYAVGVYSPQYGFNAFVDPTVAGNNLSVYDGDNSVYANIALTY